MSEKILFSIPIPAPYEDPAYEMLWFQGNNGLTWDTVPVDTILVSDLVIDPVSGKYEWDSALANPVRYHLIKSRSQAGVVSQSGVVLPPRFLAAPSNITGISLNEPEPIYTIGDSVELILQVDAGKISLIGDTCQVQIADNFGNVIDTIDAERIGEIYVAQYTIPIGLYHLYNPANQPEANEDNSYYYLNDRWILNNTLLSFPFKVIKIVESPVEDNAVLQVIMDGITSDTNVSSIDTTALVFSTAMVPFYTTAREVKDIYKDILDDFDNFTLARAIWNISMVIDYHMRPDYIDPKKKNAYDLAVRNYTKFQAALSLLAPIMQTSSESKELDTFKISRTAGNPRQILDFLEAQARKYALIIWAGGSDTPFVSRRFEKGLWDPNRLIIGRAKLDTSDRFPWVNKTSGSTLMEVDGDQVEVRGERTISLNANPRFDYSNLIGLENPEGLWLT